MTTQAKGTALITGASTGIGAVFADRFAKRGHDLILVARNKARLAALARRIANDTGRKVDTVAADLADAADLRRVEDILRTNAGISLLVNNAGVGATASAGRLRCRQDGRYGPPERHRAHPPDLCGGAGICGPPQRHDHQHCVDRRDRAGAH